ncbi:hypothetical protein ACFLXY_10865 [Chloroflexota bacterium]
MKNIPVPKIGLIITLAILLSGCNSPKPENPQGLQPLEYTHTIELKQIELYEYEQIRNAERSVVVTLEQLGYDNLTITGGDEVSTPAIEYMLPDDATQGPDTWYIFNLHFLIEFEEDTGEGFCTVAAKGAGTSVKFETYRVNGSPFIRFDAQSSNSTRIEVRYYNYMMTGSVKPGTSEMSFTLKQYPGARVRNVIIYSDSGIEATGTAPSDYEEGLKLSQEQQAKAKELVFNDSRVQELAEGKEYSLRIMRSDGMVRLADEPPDDNIEIRLVFAQTYMIEDIEASALEVFVNLDEAIVTCLFPLDPNGMPALTESSREEAVAIALNDPSVQRELEGKEYTVGRVSVSVGGPVGRLGANVLFVFDQPYPLDSGIPSTPAR